MTNSIFKPRRGSILSILITAIMIMFTQPVLSQSYKLECNINTYTNYSFGSLRKVAESWFPPKSTHIINGNQTYDVEFDDYGISRQQRTIIDFQYSAASSEGQNLTIKYTYLRKNNNLIGKLHGGPSTYDINVYGKCVSRTISQSEAEAYWK